MMIKSTTSKGLLDIGFFSYVVKTPAVGKTKVDLPWSSYGAHAL